MSGVLGILLGDNATAVTYVGPGDVTNYGSSIGWWGLRAFKASGIGANCINITRSSDSTSKTIVTAANGFLNTADTFFNGSTYTINTVFDQSGGGNNLDIAASSPTLVLSVLSGFPVMRFGGGWIKSTNSLAQAQPFYTAFVASRTGATSAFSQVIASNGASIRIGFPNATGNASINAGTTLSAAATDNTFHAVNGLFNRPGGAAASFIKVDSVAAVTGDVGAASDPLSGIFAMASNTFNAEFTGDICEVGLWAGTITTTDAAAMSANQHGTNGYNF